MQNRNAEARDAAHGQNDANEEHQAHEHGKAEQQAQPCFGAGLVITIGAAGMMGRIGFVQRLTVDE